MPLPTLNSFSPTTKALSAEVNFNFTEIKNIIDAMRPTLYVNLNDTIEVDTNVLPPFEMPQALTTVEVKLNIGTAPVGADLIVDILKNSSSIFSTKPQINDGAVAGGSSAVFSTTTVADGDIITYNIDQVGSTTPGSDLTMALVFKL